MNGYRYTESGLDNVIIHGVSFIKDDAGEQVVTIHNIAGLHRAIATAIVMKPVSMSGKELRFLRTEMGMTQAELAAIVHREPLAISRWERGEVEQIDMNAETVIRLHAKEILELNVNATVRAMSEWSVPTAMSPPLEIDGSNPDDYKPLIAA
jgi:transcriptional regulator with XRE-family HTH domain